MKNRLLLVEDDNNLGTVLREYLTIKGFMVVHALDGEAGLREFKKGSFDLIILDIMMPKLDGFSTAKYIRNQNSDIPIIFLTAKTLQEDKIEGFKIGADDYVTKPFSTEELLLRIKAILKRYSSAETEQQENYEIGNYLFCYPKRELRGKTTEKKLTSKEAELLNLLCINKNKVLSRPEALVKIWGDDTYFTARSMDVYITKLRTYLKEDERIEIINIHGTGYKLISPQR